MTKKYIRKPKERNNRTYKNKNKNKNSKRTFTKKHYNSGDGMLTSVWGPALWHYLHTMSFNYPNNPTKNDKKNYSNFIKNLKNVLPCKYCRHNLHNNLKVLPLKSCHLKNRSTFSKYIYQLHELINKMLKKKSNLTYCDVRERYEHFRSRCSNKKKIIKYNKTRKKESGCTDSLYGKKSKCIINIVPQDNKQKSIIIDKKCIIKAQ